MFIGVLNFVLFPENAREHLCFMAREKEEPEYVLSDHFLMHFLEAPKLETDRVDNKLKKWLAFLKYEGKEAEKVKILLSDDDIIRNDEMKELYEAHEKFLHDKASWIGDAEERGEKKGIKKGVKKGVQKNRQETAKRMKEKEMEMPLIEEITGLTKEEIEKL